MQKSKLDLRNPKTRFLLGLVLSVFVHFLFVISLAISQMFTLNSPPQETAITVDVISPAQLPPDDSSKQHSKKKPLEKPAQQIVEQDESKSNELKPEDTRFLSAKNQVVEKQQVAPDHGDFQNKKANQPEMAGSPEAKETSKKTKSANAKNDMTHFLPSLDSYALMKKQIEADSGSNKGQWNGKSDSSTGETSKTNDYLKDVQQGLETQLNTKEYKYYGYYSRIRKQLSQYWEPKVREKLSVMFRQGRSIANEADRITKLLIVLNQAGTLVNVQLLSESGVQDLDEAAVEAFRSAAPFPNPPKGIIESDGTVKIRWDFILET